MFESLTKPNSFDHKVLILMMGSTIAQSIPVAVSPILTRLYTPKEFGTFAIFFSISVIFGAVANLRYELAIMIPEEESEAINIGALAIIISTALSLLILLTVAIFHTSIVNIFGISDIGIWLYFIPISVFLTGLNNVFQYLNIRQSNYKNIAHSSIYKSATLASVQLCAGLFKRGPGGLVTGQVMAETISTLQLIRGTNSLNQFPEQINLPKIKSLAVRYKRFPLLSMWGILANTLSQHLTSIIISSVFSATTLGFYTLVQRVLGMPISLIGTAFSKVYFEEAVNEKKNTGSCSSTFNNTIKKMAAIAVPVFGLIFLTIDRLVTLIFGENWAEAGHYAKILIPMFAIRFIVIAVSPTNSIFEKQNLDLFWNLTLLAVSLTALLISHLADWNFVSFLKLLSTTISIHYLLLYAISRRVAKGETQSLAA